ncbi:MAG: hypothetical protein L0Y76_09320 [Ignavibacteria bacterium]|nr:hypothetical protein [Ignavibacteria bacterium]
MRKFIVKILLLGIPAYLYAGFILITDPYNYFGISSFIDNDLKARTTYMINPVLGNMLAYKNNPVPNITISDSRFAHKNLNGIKKNTGMEFSELYAHDGLIQEFISFFRFADALVKLENVYICVNFSAFSESKRNNLVESANNIINRPFLYLFNRNVAEASVLCLKNRFNPQGERDLSMPSADRKSFWIDLLNTTELRFYKNYFYPENYMRELREIGAYCRSKNIKLGFIIPPTNTDMQALIQKNNLNQFRERFLKELSEIAPVYDMDFPNAMTSDTSLYLDPNHLQKDRISGLFENILVNEPDSLRKYINITIPAN